MFFVFAAAFVVKSAVLTASLVTFQHPVHPIRHKYGAKGEDDVCRDILHGLLDILKSLGESSCTRFLVK